jgi:hypothetical protein
MLQQASAGKFSHLKSQFNVILRRLRHFGADRK